MEAEAERPRRPAGLLVIIGTYALGWLVSIALINVGSPHARPIGMVLAVGCFLVAFGLWCRSELTRKVLVGLLALALFLHAVLFVVYVAGFAGVLDLPANVKPLRAIGKSIFQVWFTWWMFTYLRRDDIRAFFRSEAAPAASVEPDPP